MKNTNRIRFKAGNYFYANAIDKERVYALCDRFNAVKHPCPKCGRKVVLAKWWLRGGYALVCLNPNCTWGVRRDCRNIADSLHLAQIEAIEIQLRKIQKHKHEFINVGEREICIRCGEWR